MRNKTGKYNPQNPDKYVGKTVPFWRSTWELAFMRMCDNHQSILKWASEPLQIPYQHPITGQHTIYVPDFLIEYVDSKGMRHVELIEIKPACQTYPNLAKKKKDQAALVVNLAKWKAASHFSKKNSMKFRVITEEDMYHNYGKK